MHTFTLVRLSVLLYDSIREEEGFNIRLGLTDELAPGLVQRVDERDESPCLVLL